VFEENRVGLGVLGIRTRLLSKLGLDLQVGWGVINAYNASDWVLILLKLAIERWIAIVEPLTKNVTFCNQMYVMFYKLHMIYRVKDA
jgi:hypothetical protein